MSVGRQQAGHGRARSSPRVGNEENEEENGDGEHCRCQTRMAGLVLIASKYYGSLPLITLLQTLPRPTPHVRRFVGQRAAGRPLCSPRG